MQGRAIFGLACLATLPATATTLARARPSADFEVLVDSAQCARWMTYYQDATRPMQTGTDLEGKPTYSCRGIVRTSGLPDKSKYLGRFVPGSNGVTDQCVCELQSSVRVAPSASCLGKATRNTYTRVAPFAALIDAAFKAAKHTPLREGGP